jgi:hypothetical protein
VRFVGLIIPYVIRCPESSIYGSVSWALNLCLISGQDQQVQSVFRGCIDGKLRGTLRCIQEPSTCNYLQTFAELVTVTSSLIDWVAATHRQSSGLDLPPRVRVRTPSCGSAHAKVQLTRRTHPMEIRAFVSLHYRLWTSPAVGRQTSRAFVDNSSRLF